MKNFLTDDQIQELREAHRAERNRRAAYKINAVILLGTGWKLKAAREALSSYVDKYRSGSIAELIKTNQGHSNHLNGSQRAKLCEKPENKLYLMVHAVIKYVRETFGFEHALSNMQDLLHRLSYGLQKPKLRTL
ncbi:MAG: hypothetical protein K0U59_00240 [Gammaproteobacteria bacterium]|nr:hypothetical protein [Gammaproteobacteria bacterium]